MLCEEKIFHIELFCYVLNIYMYTHTFRIFKHEAYLVMMFDEYKAPVLINNRITFQHQMLVAT